MLGGITFFVALLGAQNVTDKFLDCGVPKNDLSV
jgi:hypothetical protein